MRLHIILRSGRGNKNVAPCILGVVRLHWKAVCLMNISSVSTSQL